MKQDLDSLTSFTLAKSLVDENFDENYNIITLDGVDYKFKLIGCTYHCG